MKIILPRKWYLAIIGIENWCERAENLQHNEFIALKEIIDNFIAKTNKSFRKNGAIAASLFWSTENLSPIYLLEATRDNERFLKENRIIYQNLTEQIMNSLTIEEKQSSLGKNLQQVNPNGKVLLLECTIPAASDITPSDEQVIKAFSDALNAEFLTIKRSEHDFNGRSIWLSSLDSVLSRGFMQDVGPVKKLRSAKETEGKRLYEKKTPGDFEKISRALSEAVYYRPSLFELEPPKPDYDERASLGHLIIHYLVADGEFPNKLQWRSVTHERIGRKIEDYQWFSENDIDWKEMDKLQLYAEQISYDKVEKVIADVGGVKFDSIWTERDLSHNIYFLTKFSFTEDILKTLLTFTNSDARSFLEPHIGLGAIAMLELWQKANVYFNMLVFEIKGLDS
ncbi:MAG: hypothetical protein FK734_06225, partial [Asgard group archaeon]|nr:hypothetical protein [Asgard group archaeon]